MSINGSKMLLSLRVALIALCLLSPMVAATRAKAAAPTGNNYATIVGEPGADVLGGMDRLFNEPEAISITGEKGFVHVKAEANGKFFSLEVAAPSGKELEDGEYAEAEGVPFRSKGSPGIGVSAEGTGCSQEFGRFVIKDIHFGVLGNVERFSAFYERHCEERGSPALFGEVSYGEPSGSAPELVQPSAIEWPHTSVGTRSVQAPVTIAAGESGAQIASVGLAGTDSGDFSIAGNTCSGTTLTPHEECVIALATKPTAAGPRSAQLVLTDKSGTKTTVPLSVNPNPPPPPPVSNDYATMVSEPEEYVGGGTDRLFNEPGAVSITSENGAVHVKTEAKGEHFFFEFAAPSGRQLEVGEYTEAEGPSKTKDLPGISISGDGRSCGESVGRFVIKDIHLSVSGSVERFWASYEQDCGGIGGRPLFGEISFGEPATTAPELVQPSAIEWPRTSVGASSAQVPITVTAGESGAQVAAVSLAGAKPADFAIASDTCVGTTLAPRQTCQIGLLTKPTQAGPRAAQVVITDKTGAKTTVPLSVNPNPPAPAPASNNYVTMVWELDGAGAETRTKVFNESGALSVTGTKHHVSVYVEAEGDQFLFDFAPAAGKELQDGEYVEAERYGFETRGSPGMSVDGDGSGCNHDFGRFVIRDIHFDTSGNVERFSAFYEQHCEQPGAPALFGEISYGESPTTAPELVQPSAVEWPRTPVGMSSVQVPVTVTAGESGAQVDSVSLAGTDSADFSIAGDTCVGTTLAPAETCQIALSTKPTKAGPRGAQLVLTDKSGATTIVALSVNPTPPPPHPVSSNYVTMVSEPGDFMGAGMDTLFNWSEAVAVTGNRGAVDVEAQQKGQGFSFEFAAPSGQELKVGEYAGAEQDPIKGRPGISVSGDGRGCDLTLGRFVVKDIHFGAAGNPERLWALYEQHCEGAEEPALFGEISYGEPPTTAPELVQPSAIDWPRTPVGASSAPVPVTVTAGESGAHVASVSLAGANPEEFAIASDTCSGTTLAPRQACQIALSAKPTAAGSAQLILTDTSGAKTTVALQVGPEPASAPGAYRNFRKR